MAKMSRFGLVQTALMYTAPNLIKVVEQKLDTIQLQKYPDMPKGGTMEDMPDLITDADRQDLETVEDWEIEQIPTGSTA